MAWLQRNAVRLSSLVLGFGISAFSARSAAQTDVHLLKHLSGSVQFEVSAGVPSVDTVGVSSRGLVQVKLHLPGCVPSNDRWHLPQRLVWLAVPRGRTPVLGPVQTSGSAVLLTGVDLGSSDNHDPNQVPDSFSEPPDSAVVTIGDPVFFRRFRLVPVRFRLLGYDVESGVVRLTKRVRVTVRFRRQGDGRKAAAAAGTEPAPGFLSRLVLNPGDLQADVGRTHSRLRAPRDAWSRAQWFRIETSKPGLVIIPWEVLRKAGADSLALALGNVAVFEGSGKPYAEDVSAAEPALDLVPFTFLYNSRDSTFGRGNSLVYVAHGPEGWQWDEQNQRFQHWVNPFTTRSVAWLAVGGPPGAKMQMDSVSLSGEELAKEVVRRVYHFEDDRELPDDSGTEWLWRYLTPSMLGNFDFDLPDLASSDSVVLRLRLVGLSEKHHSVSISVNGSPVARLELAFKRAEQFELVLPPVVRPTGNRLRLFASERGSIVGLDWFEIEAKCNAKVSVGLDLMSPPARGLIAVQDAQPESILAVRVGGAEDPRVVRPGRDAVGRPVLRLDPGSRLLVWRKSQIQRPVSIRQVPEDPREGDLRRRDNSADYLVIGPKAAVESGPIERLLAFHADQGWLTMAVCLEDVYDQFGWGQTDPVAIRNFLRYAFDFWQRAPRWIVFVGDATYDVRNVLGRNGELVCPSHESRTTVSDDWFVQFTRDRVPDAAVGRLAVKTVEGLESVVSKILSWEKQPAPGLWRATVTFVADDAYRKREYFPEDEVFERDTERLTQEPGLADFDVTKLYLEAFHWDAAGNRPGARQAFLSALNGGTVFVNYLGHANWNQIAHETLFLSPDDFEALHNREYLPVVFAGTCETARVDDPHFDSLGELALLKENGGAVVWIGCARWTAHAASVAVDGQLVRSLFANEARGTLPIGDALLQAKIAAGFPDQTETVFLLGDPLASLPIPRDQIEFTDLPDTVDARHRIWVRGNVVDRGTEGYQGEGHVAIRLRDSMTSFNASIGPVWLPGQEIYRGVFPTKDGRYEAGFFVSKDTLAGGRRGRLVAVAWTGNGSEFLALGRADSIIVKPDTVAKGAERDTTAPQLTFEIAEGLLGKQEDLLLVGEAFRATLVVRDSGLVPSDGGFWVEIVDESTGNSWQFPSRDFQAREAGTFWLAWNVDGWSMGEHELRICATDAAGNRTRLVVRLRVVPRHLELSDVLPFPNPADRQVQIFLHLNQEAEVCLTMYTLTGRRVWQWKGFVPAGEAQIPEVPWDLSDQDGDPVANGIYLFRVEARAVWGGRRPVSTIGKIAIAR